MINVQEIYKWWDVFKNGHDLTEIRIIHSQWTCSGYFKDVDTLIKALEPYADIPHAQIYFTLNHIKDACYSRAQRDKIIKIYREPTTGDGDIDGRTHVLIDLDPIRPTGVSSSDVELEYAHRKAADIYKYLLEQGFNEPIVCKSGNGYHLAIPCQIAATAETTNVIKRFLQVIGVLFTDEHVDVDLKVFNLARICKIPGSTAMKGENSPERPWRNSEIVKIPKEIRPTEYAYFKKIAELYPQDDVRPNRSNGYSTDRFDLVAFLQKYNIGYKTERIADGTKYILDHCPFNEQHKHKDAVLFQRDNGAISFVCLHNSCADKDWKAFRTFFDPDAYSHENGNPYRTYKPINYAQREVQPQLADNGKGDIWQIMSDIDDEDRSKIVSIPSGIIQYDKECCGFDKPSLNVWSGNNGSAKSTLLNQIALNAVNNGFKVGIYSGELRGMRLKRWLILQAAGKRYNLKSTYNSYDYYTPSLIKDKIVRWLGDKLYNYNTKYSHNIDVVCKEIENLVIQNHVDMVIADNLSSLDIDELDSTVNEQQKKAIKTLVRLTEKLGVAFHLIVHPKKNESFLRKNDVSGVKTITDLADNVFFVHRWNLDTQKAAKDFLPTPIYNDLNNSGATNIVEVVKHREFGNAEGHIYKLFYEPESRRLKNSIAETVRYGWDAEPVQESVFPENNDGLPFPAPTNDTPF